MPDMNMKEDWKMKTADANDLFDNITVNKTLIKCPVDYRVGLILNIEFMIVSLIAMIWYSIFSCLPAASQHVACRLIVPVGISMIVVWMIVGKIVSKKYQYFGKTVRYVGFTSCMLLLGIRFSMGKDWLGILLTLIFFLFWILYVYRGWIMSKVLLTIYHYAIMMPQHDVLKIISEKISSIQE